MEDDRRTSDQNTGHAREGCISRVSDTGCDGFATEGSRNCKAVPNGNVREELVGGEIDGVPTRCSDQDDLDSIIIPTEILAKELLSSLIIQLVGHYLVLCTRSLSARGALRIEMASMSVFTVAFSV